MKKLIHMMTMGILSLSMLTACSNSETNRLETITERGQLIVSTCPDYAPYEFIDPTKSGQDAVVGADIAFAKYIADKLEVELVVEAMGFDAALAAVQEGKADLVISGLAYREERAETMLLSDYYNQSSYQGILVLKSQLDQYKTAEDFAGKLLGAQNASLQQGNVETQLPEAELEIIGGLTDGIMMLRTEKIDGLAISGISGEQYAGNYDDIAMSDFRFETDSDGNVLGIKKGETELLAKINEIIAEINELGLYDEWKEEALALSQSLSVE